MLTEFHKSNMRKHIAFLENNADRIRASFDMSRVRHSCGSPSCSMGFARVSLDCPYTEGTLEFIENVFGIKWSNQQGIMMYLFDAEWVNVNNTPEAAAARMKAVLYNQVPKDWQFIQEFAHPIVIEELESILDKSETLEKVIC